MSTIRCYQCSSLQDPKCKDSEFFEPKPCLTNTTLCAKYYVLGSNGGTWSYLIILLKFYIILFLITTWFIETDIVIRSCGVAQIEDTCEQKVIDGKNNNQEMKFCYSTCYIDACNKGTHLLKNRKLTIIFIAILILWN